MPSDKFLDGINFFSITDVIQTPRKCYGSMKILGFLLFFCLDLTVQIVLSNVPCFFCCCDDVCSCLLFRMQFFRHNAYKSAGFHAEGANNGECLPCHIDFSYCLLDQLGCCPLHPDAYFLQHQFLL
jgi:hypothetical protein